MKQMDLNHDGVVSWSEFLEVIYKYLEKIGLLSSGIS